MNGEEDWTPEFQAEMATLRFQAEEELRVKGITPDSELPVRYEIAVSAYAAYLANVEVLRDWNLL